MHDWMWRMSCRGCSQGTLGSLVWTVQWGEAAATQSVSQEVEVRQGQRFEMNAFRTDGTPPALS